MYNVEHTTNKTNKTKVERDKMQQTKPNYNIPTELKYKTIKAYEAVLNNYAEQSEYEAEQLLNMQEAVYLLKEDIETDIKSLFDEPTEISDLEMEL